MAPPSWAKDFVNGESAQRRLAGGNSTVEFSDDFFNDETTESRLMRAHTFYLCIVVGITFIVHKLVYMFFRHKSMDVPTVLRAPGVEIQLFLVVFMGMLDVSAQVLTARDSAPGWKMLACLELAFVSFFFVFLIVKGVEFLRVVNWEPVANVRRMRLADMWKLLDRNNDDSITLDELLDAAPKLGLTKVQATEMFHRLDANNSGTIDQDEFYAGFKTEMVAVELSTPVERLWAYFVQPRRPGGKYTAKDPEKTNLEDPWISLFMSTTPRHVHFLALRIAIMVVEAFALGGMHGWAQGAFLTTFSFITASLILASPPAVLLAQSRADTIDAVGKFLTYVIYSMIFPGWITVGDAAKAMTIINAFMLIHSIFTQMEPVVKGACFTLTALLVSIGLSKSPAADGDDEEKVGGEQEMTVVPSDLGELSVKDAVALVWQGLKTQARSQGAFPADFYQALKEAKTFEKKAKKPRQRVASHRPVEKLEPEETEFNASSFDNAIASMNLRGMTQEAIEAYLSLATNDSGELMTAEELFGLLMEPKYSTDGHMSKFARTESRLSKDLFADPSINDKKSTVTKKGTSKARSVASSGRRAQASPLHARSSETLSPSRDRAVSLDDEIDGGQLETSSKPASNPKAWSSRGHLSKAPAEMI